MLRRLGGESAPWDVLVLGGGATGLAVALDAAARGFRTALIEQGDFAQATSSRSTKLVHGGVRYLQQADIGLVREALRERGRLLENAPHLVKPQPFVVPAYHWWEKAYYGIGLKLYDRLAGALGIGRTRLLSRDEVEEHIPTIETAGLRGGVLYQDARFDDARLAISLALTCADLGGVPANHLRATGFLKRGGRVDGVRARDALDGTEFEIAARVVINATGIFSDETRALEDGSAPRLMRLSQGSHVVLPGSFLPGGTALMAPRTDDGRVFFAIPWHGRCLIGTTEVAADGPRMEPPPQAEEISFLMKHAARYLARDPAPADIRSVFAGLRPLVRRAAPGKRTAALSRSHEIVVSPGGLVSIMGGKWTTCRQMAEDTVDAAAEAGGLRSTPCRTADLRLHEPPEESSGARLHPALPYHESDVTRAVRLEMACTLDDVLSRRLRALPLDAPAAMEIAPRVAALMAEELGRDESWTARELESFRRIANAYLPPA